MPTIDAHSLRLSALGTRKMGVLIQCAHSALAAEGAAAELGVWRGGSAREIARIFEGRLLHLFDTFTGIPFQGEHDVHKPGDFSDVVLREVREVLWEFSNNIEYHVGPFPQTTAKMKESKFAFVHIDADQYQSTVDALEYFYLRMSPGGVMLFDDYEWSSCPGVKIALEQFLSDKDEKLNTANQHQAILVKQ